jgi:hypothetical protein
VQSYCLSNLVPTVTNYHNNFMSVGHKSCSNNNIVVIREEENNNKIALFVTCMSS